MKNLGGLGRAESVYLTNNFGEEAGVDDYRGGPSILAERSIAAASGVSGQECNRGEPTLAR